MRNRSSSYHISQTLKRSAFFLAATAIEGIKAVCLDPDPRTFSDTCPIRNPCDINDIRQPISLTSFEHPVANLKHYSLVAAASALAIFCLWKRRNKPVNSAVVHEHNHPSSHPQIL